MINSSFLIGMLCGGIISVITVAVALITDEMKKK